MEKENEENDDDDDDNYSKKRFSKFNKSRFNDRPYKSYARRDDFKPDYVKKRMYRDWDDEKY